MFPQTFSRNSNDAAAVMTSRKRTLNERICIVREQYKKSQNNLQQLMAKVDSYLHINLNPLTQQTEYYACLQTLDYIALYLEDFSIWCHNFEAKPFEEMPVMDNAMTQSSTQLSTSPPAPTNTPSPANIAQTVVTQSKLSASPPPFVPRMHGPRKQSYQNVHNAQSMPNNSNHSKSIPNISNSHINNYNMPPQMMPNPNMPPPMMHNSHMLVPMMHNPNMPPYYMNPHLPKPPMYYPSNIPVGHFIPHNQMPMNMYPPNAPNQPTPAHSSQAQAGYPQTSSPAPRNNSDVLVPCPAPVTPASSERPKSTMKRYPSQKRCNEMLIDFSSASSLSEDASSSAKQTVCNPVQSTCNAETALPSQFHVKPDPSPEPLAEPAYTKKKIDQLEAQIAVFKVQDDDPSVCELPAQEILDPNKVYDCIVSYGGSPSHFYVMTDPFDQRGFPVSRITEEMEEYYSKNKFDVRSLLKDMVYCAVKQNDEWFRCYIDGKNLLEDKLEVYFVDYGGVEAVTLDMVQPLVPRFCEKAPFVRKCQLYGVEPVDGKEWSVEALKLMGDLHCSTVLKLKVEDDYSEILGVTLMLPTGESVNGRLVSAGLAVSTCAPPPAPSPPVHSAPVANAAYKNASRGSLPSLSYGSSAMGSTNIDPWDISDCPEYTDPLMAVQGYSNRDEAEICKHYKGPPATTCFKGTNCTKKHILMHPDGWTLDKVEVVSEPPQLCLPAEGSQVWVYVSHVETYKLFYVQLSDVDKNGAVKSTVPSELTRLISRMNAPSVSQSMLPLTELPAPGEMVTAWFPDKKLYRAQVIDVDAEHKRIQVLYVDFGNRCWTTMDQVYQLSAEFLATPFLAMRCMLAEMNLKDEAYLKEAIKEVKACLAEKPYSATVVNHTDSAMLCLELEDRDGFSVVHTLVTKHPRLFSLQPVPRKKTVAAPKGPRVVPG